LFWRLLIRHPLKTLYYRFWNRGKPVMVELHHDPDKGFYP